MACSRDLRITRQLAILSLSDVCNEKSQWAAQAFCLWSCFHAGHSLFLAPSLVVVTCTNRLDTNSFAFTQNLNDRFKDQWALHHVAIVEKPHQNVEQKSSCPIAAHLYNITGWNWKLAPRSEYRFVVSFYVYALNLVIMITSTHSFINFPNFLSYVSV